MENKEFAKQLEERTLLFGVRIVQLSAKLPNTNEAKVIRTQITKAGTSIGANYHEANRARSKADFKNKMKICESESSETVYWLKIIRFLKWIDNNKTDLLFKEAEELLAIFTSISNKLN